MNGYWTALLPDDEGRLVLEVDQRSLRYVGRAYLYPKDPDRGPSLVAHLDIPARYGAHTFALTFFPLSQFGVPITNQQAIAEQFPSLTLPSTISVTAKITRSTISFTWKASDQIEHSLKVMRSASDQPSNLPVLDVKTWGQFKDFVRSMPHYRHIYRGQSKPWRLRTPFHRTGRGDLAHFFSHDISTLHRALSGSTRSIFNLMDPTHNAAFLSLIQHHGYPTPLLDWTYSPYVAAYFAFKTHLSARPKTTDSIRIFILDKQAWCSEFQPIFSTEHRWPHFTIVEPLALNNQRLIPQQALSSYTTVDDIESYILSREADRSNSSAPLLRAVDLPSSEGPAVMRELTQMGITAASLFPGLDGICEEMRLRNFVFSKD